MRVELAREKHGRSLQDLVRAPQLEVLLPQPLDLLALLSRRQIRRRPSFASTWRTYFRSVSDGSPRSAATCAIGRPDSNTTRVARSNSSTGYFLALGITDLLPPENPAIKVSVKPGTARECPNFCVGMSEKESHVYGSKKDGRRIGGPRRRPGE